MFKVIIAFCALDGTDCVYLALPPRFKTEFECSTYQIDFITSGRADAKSRELKRPFCEWHMPFGG